MTLGKNHLLFAIRIHHTLNKILLYTEIPLEPSWYTQIPLKKIGLFYTVKVYHLFHTTFTRAEDDLVLVFCYNLQEVFYTVASIINRNDLNLREFISETGHDLQSNLRALPSESSDDLQQVLHMNPYIKGPSNQGSSNSNISRQTNCSVRSSLRG